MQPSNSFNYKNYTPNKSYSTPKNDFASPLKSPPRQSSDLPTYVVEGDNVLPLTHTVSFYRKQQNQVRLISLITYSHAISCKYCYSFNSPKHLFAKYLEFQLKNHKKKEMPENLKL